MERDEVLASTREALTKLKPSLEGILVELLRQQRQLFDNSDFVINEFRALVSSLNGLTAELIKLEIH